jgi:hypothetical protein
MTIRRRFAQRSNFLPSEHIRVARFDVLLGVGQFGTDGAANGPANGHVQSLASLGSAELPDRDPGRIWGGPSPGGPCAVCRAPIGPGELEIEIEFLRNGDSADADSYHIHPKCFAARQAKKNCPTHT